MKTSSSSDYLKVDDESLERRPSIKRIRTISQHFQDPPLEKHLKESILERRDVFKWMPVFFTNDLIHGSMWFVYGSVFSIFIPIVPLLDLEFHFFKAPDDSSLSVYSSAATWILVLIAGVAFTVGSYLWARSFSFPPLDPLCSCSCFKTDELLAAWCFLIGALPTIPYSALYLMTNPELLEYWALMGAAVMFNIVTLMFLHACYVFANYENKTAWLYPIFEAIFGDGPLIRKHLNSDWLISCWLTYFACWLAIIGSGVFLYFNIVSFDDRQVFIFGSGLFDIVLFLIGTMYLLAGSYRPHITSPLRKRSPLLKM